MWNGAIMGEAVVVVDVVVSDAGVASSAFAVDLGISVLISFKKESKSSFAFGYYYCEKLLL